jgi:hypothetical protein
MAKRIYGILQSKTTEGLNRFNRTDGIRQDVEFRQEFTGSRGQTRLFHRLK